MATQNELKELAATLGSGQDPNERVEAVVNLFNSLDAFLEIDRELVVTTAIKSFKGDGNGSVQWETAQILAIIGKSSKEQQIIDALAYSLKNDDIEGSRTVFALYALVQIGGRPILETIVGTLKENFPEITVLLGKNERDKTGMDMLLNSFGNMKRPLADCVNDAVGRMKEKDGRVGRTGPTRIK